MPVHNADIGRVFDEIADLLEIQEANPFRVRAYRNAARTVENLTLDLAAAIAGGKPLPKLPGIGEDLAAKIGEIAATGTCKLLERLRKELPSGVTELLRVPGLGPKRVKALYRDLEVRTLPQLLKAAEQGRIRELQGFGPARETQIADAVKRQLSKARRFKLAVAAQYAQPLADYLRGARGADRVEIAGSYRRMRDTVGDLDLLVTARSGTRGHGPVRRLPRGGGDPRPGRHAGERAAPLRHPGRPAGGRTRVLRRRAALLHRLEGAQHRRAPHGPARG